MGEADGEGVTEGVAPVDSVLVGVPVSVCEPDCVGVPEGVGESVLDDVNVGLVEGVADGVRVGVRVGVPDRVRDGVQVAESVIELVGDLVAEGVALLEGVTMSDAPVGHDGDEGSKELLLLPLGSALAKGVKAVALACDEAEARSEVEEQPVEVVLNESALEGDLWALALEEAEWSGVAVACGAEGV